MTQDVDTTKLLEFAKAMTLNAGKIARKYYHSADLIIENKSEKDLVTIADKECEKFILDAITEKYPTHDFLGEEGTTQENDNENSDFKWIIDPIDGTTNFAHGLPIFGISVALEYKGEIIVGVIYNPISWELFYAEKNKGAYLQRISEDYTSEPQRLSVSKTNKLSKSLLVTGFHPGFPKVFEQNLVYFKRLFKASHTVRRLGAASIDLAYTAAGHFEGYWELKLKPWDMAAGVLIVTEAGGKLTNTDGTPFSIYEESLLATNGLIHDEILEHLKS